MCVAVLARDLQSVVFYDSKGQFVGVRRPGSGKPIEVEGVQVSCRQQWQPAAESQPAIHELAVAHAPATLTATPQQP